MTWQPLRKHLPFSKQEILDMSKFTAEQIQKHITDEFIRQGHKPEAARSAAIEGANYYISHPGATLVGSLAWAKTHLKTAKRVKDKPTKKIKYSR